MKIAILLTDIDVSEFALSWPDDGEKFRRLMAPLRPDWSFTTFPVRDGVFPDDIAAFDGLLITGSPASVHDDRPWIAPLLDLIRRADSLRLPMVGACFGHQAIAVALGGQVGRSARGWGLGTTVTRFTRHLDWMQPRHGALRLYCAHNEQVTVLPPGAVVLGHDPIAPVSAFAIGGHVLCTQHHPEMTPDYVAGLLDYMAADVPPQVLARARRSAAKGAQGRLFAGWMAGFYEAAQAGRRDRTEALAA